MTTNLGYMYRYEPYNESNLETLELFDNAIGSLDFIMRPNAYRIIRFTPKGVVIDAYNTVKFINLSWRKKWACPTLKEAKESFIARKERQVIILKAQLARAEAQLLCAEAGKFEETEI